MASAILPIPDHAACRIGQRTAGECDDEILPRHGIPSTLVEKPLHDHEAMPSFPKQGTIVPVSTLRRAPGMIRQAR